MTKPLQRHRFGCPVLVVVAVNNRPTHLCIDGIHCHRIPKSLAGREILSWDVKLNYDQTNPRPSLTSTATAGVQGFSFIFYFANAPWRAFPLPRNANFFQSHSPLGKMARTIPTTPIFDTIYRVAAMPQICEISFPISTPRTLNIGTNFK